MRRTREMKVDSTVAGEIKRLMDLSVGNQMWDVIFTQSVHFDECGYSVEIQVISCKDVADRNNSKFIVFSQGVLIKHGDDGADGMEVSCTDFPTVNNFFGLYWLEHDGDEFEVKVVSDLCDLCDDLRYGGDNRCFVCETGMPSDSIKGDACSNCGHVFFGSTMIGEDR